jgi:uncharacterized protein YdcH (DUF465 family)
MLGHDSASSSNTALRPGQLRGIKSKFLASAQDQTRIEVFVRAPERNFGLSVLMMHRDHDWPFVAMATLTAVDAAALFDQPFSEGCALHYRFPVDHLRPACSLRRSKCCADLRQHRLIWINQPMIMSNRNHSVLKSGLKSKNYWITSARTFCHTTPIDPAPGACGLGSMTIIKEEFLAMMRIPHELPEEFPEEAPFIERLAKTNHEFRRLTTRYDEVNRKIYRIESDEAPTTDVVLENLKKRRLKLKDEIAAALAKLERRL